MEQHQPAGRAHGSTALVPPSLNTASPGRRAAALLMHLREASIPVPVIAAAAELIADLTDDPDPVTREAASAIHARLIAALEDSTLPR